MEKIFKEYYKRLVYFATKFLYDEMDAEDVVSEVFLKNWGRLQEMQGDESIKKFLYRCVKNAALNMRISKRNQERGRNDLLYLIGEEYVEVSMLETEAIWAIRQKIEDLPREERHTMLYYLVGRSTSWIAERMNITQRKAREIKLYHVTRMKLMLLKKGIIN